MALNDVTFKQYDGALGRALAGNDHFSGLVINLPSIADKFGLYYSVNQAEADGITASAFPLSHYQISQYFAQNSQGVLYYYHGAKDVDVAVEALQNYAEGNMKQVAVLDSDAFATSTIQALQAAADTLEVAHEELVILYSADFTGTTLSALPSLATMSCPNVSVQLGADKTGGNALGAVLGVLSASKVSQNIGAVKYFNLVKGTEYNVLAFATGEDYRSKSNAELSAVADKGYNFLRKYQGRDGSYVNDSKTATLPTSDFSQIENVRTIQKAKRVIRFALVPELGEQLFTNGNVLNQLTLKHFTLLTSNPLENMQNNAEINGYSVVINPNQNVLATNKIEISVAVTPLGVAKQIVVGIGFQL